MKGTFKSSLTMLFCLLFIGGFGQGYPTVDDEFVGPFPSWKIITTGNDSVTDASPIIQAAVDSFKNGNYQVIYLTPGTYRLTQSISVIDCYNISILGAHPDSVRVIWDGPQGNYMFDVNGTAYARFGRMTLDGKGLAKSGFEQSWQPGGGGGFDTGNEYADFIFQNLITGIRGGFRGHGFAETTIERCIFRNCNIGVEIGNFNALDIWVQNNTFLDCVYGVTNIYGSGNFQVYHNNFYRSTEADIRIGHTGGFAIRENYSYKSRYFFFAGFSNNGCPTTIQGNVIVDPTERAIEIRNHGPYILVDNSIRTHTAPAVGMWGSTDIISIGNQFTVFVPIQGAARLIAYDKPPTNYTGLDTAPKVLPGFAVNMNRQVFEVPYPATAASLQAAINAAHAAGNRSIVHISRGKNHFINTTVTVPANSDIQIVGDGNGDRNPTILTWTGDSTGTMLVFEGPTRATIRDISLKGSGRGKNRNILVKNIDQANSRIFSSQLQLVRNDYNMIVNGLNNALVWNQGWGFNSASKVSVQIIGGSAPTTGRVINYGGCESDNQLSYSISNNAKVLVRDNWFENGTAQTYLNASSGNIAFEGNMQANANLSLNDFTGKALFAVIMDDFYRKEYVTGNGAGGKVLNLGMVTRDTQFVYNSSQTDVRSIMRRLVDPNAATSGVGTHPISDLGTYDSAYLVDMLEQVREVKFLRLKPTPVGSSDLRIFRIWSYDAGTGIEFLPGDVSLPVTFSSINVDCKKSTINWRTNTSSNASRFEIEGSVDATNFIKLGSVSPSTNTFTYNGNYSFFRVAQVDRDGRRFYTSVVKSSCETSFGITVYPNPVVNNALLTVRTPKSDKVTVSIFNQVGVLVQRFEQTLSSGVTQIPINSSNLSKGVYNIVVTNGEQTQTARLIK